MVTANPPQLIRKSDSGQLSGFKSPIAQLESNCELFEDWLNNRGLSLPVYGAVVLAYAKQRIEVFDTEVPILFPHAVPTFIRKLPTGSLMLDNQAFRGLLNSLKKCHRPFIPAPICSTYAISKQDIRTGVICPGCGGFGMEKYSGGWRCLSCGKTSRKAHEQAIRDWFLLFGGEMRNKDCRTFLHVDRQQTAHRLLVSMELKTKGTYRDRVYKYPYQLKE
ncbi:nuclease-related domain-containing protein [Sporosarcina sp. ITBMC105]